MRNLEAAGPFAMLSQTDAKRQREIMNDFIAQERTSTAARPEPSPEQAIRERAYAIWQEEGRPEGRDVDHWLRAEDEIGSKACSRD